MHCMPNVLAVILIQFSSVLQNQQIFCNLLRYFIMHSGKSLFPNICGMPLLWFFWLKWAGYLAEAGLNLLAQISDRISPFGV